MSLFGMPLLFGRGRLSLLFSIALCVHVVRTNQPIYWIFAHPVRAGAGQRWST